MTLHSVYRVGNTLKLRTVERQENVTVDIIDIFLPFTWSAVLKVKLYKGTINENVAVLKLYDRRRCPGLRKDYQKPPWTPTRDEEYLEFVRNGGATEFISRITSNGHLPESKFSAVEDEAWIQERCRRLWRSESGTYQTLKDLQGVCVPRLLYEVICCPTTSLGPTADLLEVPGTLIDFIDGFNLKDMFLHIPKDHWQSVCTQAVNVVNHISDHNILNQDARMHNMIVRTRKREGATTGPSSEASVVDSYDVFEIDFGLCRNRGPDETDDQWNEAKWRQHEDENIGAWLQVTARKDHGVEIEWRGTRRYDGPWVLDNLADDFPYEEFLISEMYGLNSSLLNTCLLTSS